jgi:xanthine dehydrogenase accessory factor
VSVGNDRLVVVRGAGDLGTGCIVRLVRSGFRVVALELPDPRAVRRTVSLSEAVHDGAATVEDVRGIRRCGVPADWAVDEVPVLVDPEASTLGALAPFALVDAIMAKRNLGTRIDMAPVVVGLGPGFVAGRDVHAVVETNRGHDLGRVIFDGATVENTGVPGLVAGRGVERVLHAPADGVVETSKAIGDLVEAGEPVLAVDGAPVHAAIAGVVRGLLRPGSAVHAGMKVGDVDPRGTREICYTISDKARAVAGGVLEAILMLAPPRWL